MGTGPLGIAESGDTGSLEDESTSEKARQVELSTNSKNVIHTVDKFMQENPENPLAEFLGNSLNKVSMNDMQNLYNIISKGKMDNKTSIRVKGILSRKGVPGQAERRLKDRYKPNNGLTNKPAA